MSTLLFHSIADEARALSHDPRWERTMKPKTFYNVLRKLSRHYNFIAVSEFISQGCRFKDRQLLVTFDDGYLDNYHAAAPILRDLDIPAVFFVTTGFALGTQPSWWVTLWRQLRERKRTTLSLGDTRIVLGGATRSEKENQRTFGLLAKKILNLRYSEYMDFLKALGQISDPSETKQFMSSKEIRALNEVSNFTIGGHSHCHFAFGNGTSTDLRSDLQRSKLDFVLLGIPQPKLFAYPHGSFSQIGAAQLSGHGYEYAFIAQRIRRKTSACDLHLARLAVFEKQSFMHLSARLWFRGAGG